MKRSGIRNISEKRIIKNPVNLQFGVKNHWKALMGEWDAGINAGYGGFFWTGKQYLE